MIHDHVSGIRSDNVIVLQEYQISLLFQISCIYYTMEC